MHILSTPGYVSGQPRIEGHRIWVSIIIANVAQMGLEEFLEDFELKGERDKVREAIEYCMNERCVNNVHRYCHGCNKSQESPGEDLWKKAKILHEQYFKA